MNNKRKGAADACVGVGGVGTFSGGVEGKGARVCTVHTSTSLYSLHSTSTSTSYYVLVYANICIQVQVCTSIYTSYWEGKGATYSGACLHYAMCMYTESVIQTLYIYVYVYV